MRKYIAIILTAMFLVTALFGFISVNTSTDHMGLLDGTCPIAKLLNFACTPDLISMILQHISAFQSFFGTPLIPVFSLALLSIVLGLVGLLLVSLLSLFLNSNFGLLFKQHFYRLIDFLATKKFLSWFSLLENSPSIV